MDDHVFKNLSVVAQKLLEKTSIYQVQPKYRLKIRTVTCDKLSHCLFDFDCPDLAIYEREQYKYEEFVLTKNEISKNLELGCMTIEKLLRRDNMLVNMEDYYGDVGDSKNFVLRVMYKQDSGSIWGFNNLFYEEPDPDVEEEPEEEVDLQKTMWMVLRKNKAHNKMLKKLFAEHQAIRLYEKDIIKFGRVNFKLREANSKHFLVNNEFAETGREIKLTRNIPSSSSAQNITDMNLIGNNDRISSFVMHSSTIGQRSPRLSKIGLKYGQKEKQKDQEIDKDHPPCCRICLGEEDIAGNELIYPCKCAGTMKYIHLLCLREWLNSKKLVYSGERVRSYFWKALECELCKESFENKMKSDLYKIMDFEFPSSEYLIMESVKSAPAKVVHVFYLDKGTEFRIGRSVETDMKIADISVSRIHAFIKFNNGIITLEDNGSKFGTLVKIRQPHQLCDYGSSLFQVGRSLIQFDLQTKTTMKFCGKKQKNQVLSDHGYIQTLKGPVPSEFFQQLKSDSMNKKQGNDPYHNMLMGIQRNQTEQHPDVSEDFDRYEEDKVDNLNHPKQGKAQRPTSEATTINQNPTRETFIRGATEILGDSDVMQSTDLGRILNRDNTQDIFEREDQSQIIVEDDESVEEGKEEPENDNSLVMTKHTRQPSKGNRKDLNILHRENQKQKRMDYVNQSFGHPEEGFENGNKPKDFKQLPTVNQSRLRNRNADATQNSNSAPTFLTKSANRIASNSVSESLVFKDNQEIKHDSIIEQDPNFSRIEKVKHKPSIVTQNENESCIQNEVLELNDNSELEEEEAEYYDEEDESDDKGESENNL